MHITHSLLQELTNTTWESSSIFGRFCGREFPVSPFPYWHTAD